MLKAVGAFAGCALLVSAAYAQALDGKRITVKMGSFPVVNAPVALAYDGDMPETTVRVVQEATGKEFPVTVRDGKLVFIPEGGDAGAELTYVVKVTGDSAPPRVVVRQKGDAKVLQVIVDDKLFTEYHYDVDGRLTVAAAKAVKPELSDEQVKGLDTNGDGVLSTDDYKGMNGDNRKLLAGLVNRKPFLWPVLSEGDATVTRNWPAGKSEGPEDHLHQKSFWTAHGDLNGVDYWAEDGERCGFQRIDEVTFGSGDAFGWIHSRNTWLDKDRKPVVSETREYRFYATPISGRLFDVDVTFSAEYGDVVFGDTKEGGIIALRIRPEMNEQEVKLKDGSTVGGKGGIITTANGQGEKNVWGKPSPWCDYSGPVTGAGTRGVAFFDHPDNLRHPVRWHVRGYGLMGANYFGLKDFEPNAGQRGDWTLENGTSQVFRYRVLVHSGGAGEVKVADRYANYATPPVAAWAN